MSESDQFRNMPKRPCFGSLNPKPRKKHACKTGLEGIVSKRWIAFPLRAIAELAEVRESGSAGGEA